MSRAKAHEPQVWPRQGERAKRHGQVEAGASKYHSSELARRGTGKRTTTLVKTRLSVGARDIRAAAKVTLLYDTGRVGCVGVWCACVRVSV